MKLSNGNGRNASGFAVLVIVQIMGLILAGCSRRDTLPLVEESASADQHLPFEAASDKSGISPTGSLAPAAIPAGTPVTIHLQLSLSSASSRAGDPFEAVLDEPIIVRGHTLATRGAVLVGRVLDARSSDRFQRAGYLRLGPIAKSLAGALFTLPTPNLL